jgi:hypothetical protein
MSNPNVRCALEGCGLRRRDHLSWQAAQLTGQLHAFVEPAPQPRADAAPRGAQCMKCGCSKDAVGYCSCDDDRRLKAAQAPQCAHSRIYMVRDGMCRACPPAAPPVSGDGDEAVVREIALRWAGRDGVGARLDGAVREAIERGRALGARDEREAIEDQLRTQADEHEHAADAYPVVAYEQSLRAKCLRDEADVITKKGKAQ